MKTSFNEEEFEVFEKQIRKKGYRKYYNSIQSEDYYFCKGLKKESDEFSERTVLQLIFAVYDYNKYNHVPNIQKYHIEIRVNISRNSDERIDTCLYNENILSVEDAEIFALKLYDFININLI